MCGANEDRNGLLQCKDGVVDIYVDYLCATKCWLIVCQEHLKQTSKCIYESGSRMISTLRLYPGVCTIVPGIVEGEER